MAKFLFWRNPEWFYLFSCFNTGLKNRYFALIWCVFVGVEGLVVPAAESGSPFCTEGRKC